MILAMTLLRAGLAEPCAKAPALDVPMKGVDGKELSIAQAAGPKGTLVILTCNHCPYVKAWEERTVALGNDALARGIGVIAINANDPAVQPEDGYEAMQAIFGSGRPFTAVIGSNDLSALVAMRALVESGRLGAA